MTALLVIAILVLLIVVHELGHFVVAKFSKVRVKEFGVGYPPRAFTFVKVGDTEYTLNWIPFGGFVRLFGDEGVEEHGRGSFIDAPRWKQALILVAGVTMNAVAAWTLFAVAFHIGIPRAVDTPPPGVPYHLIVSDVVQGSPAAAVGISAGDEILKVADYIGNEITKVTAQNVIEFVRKHPGQPVQITYNHEGEVSKVSVIPAQGILPKEAGQPALGIALITFAKRSDPWFLAAQEASVQTYNSFVSVAHDVGHLLWTAVIGQLNLSDVVGPVGIVRYVGEASQTGAGAVLTLAALISVNLAIINLIPIPSLDGGRLVILGLEAVLRRPAPRLALQILNVIGITLIVLLMVTVTYHDILKLFK